MSVLWGSETGIRVFPSQTTTVPKSASLWMRFRKKVTPSMVSRFPRKGFVVKTQTSRKICSVRPQCAAADQPPT